MASLVATIHHTFNTHTHRRTSTLNTEMAVLMFNFILDYCLLNIVMRDCISETDLVILYLSKIEHHQTSNVIKVTFNLFEWEAELETYLATNFFQFLFLVFTLKIDQILASLAIVSQVLINSFYPVTNLMKTGVTFVTVNHSIFILVLCAKTHLAIGLKCLLHSLLFRFLSHRRLKTLLILLLTEQCLHHIYFLVCMAILNILYSVHPR